jgi:UDP-N-acetylmuramyl tripeptide synthase
VAALADRCGGSVTFFGLDATAASVGAVDGATDASACPSCGARLTYEWVSYAHLGGYRCRTCGFARPRPAVVVTDVEPTDDGWRACVRSRSRHVAVRTAQRGVHSLYNLAAAAAAAELVGAPFPAAAVAAAGSEPVSGRGAVTTVGRGEVVVLLGKNPTGLAQVLRSHVVERPEAPLLLVLNDEAADGRDVSWIWDAPLELLRGRGGEVLVAGSRAESMLVRLRYAEVRATGRPSPTAALDELVARVRLGGRAYVVTTYSGVSPLAARLERLAAVAPVGAAP